MINIGLYIIRSKKYHDSPKIHRKVISLKAIGEYIQTRAYRVSRVLTNVLQPLVGEIEQRIDNSQ